VNEVVFLMTELGRDKTSLSACHFGYIAPLIGAFSGERSPGPLHRKWDKRRTTWTRWEVKHLWALALLRLERYVQRLPDPFYGDKYCDEYWPKTPFVELFGEVSLAALEIAIDLGHSVSKTGRDAIRQSFDVGEDIPLDSFVKKIPVVLEPNLDPRAGPWREAMREAFLKRFPPTEWPKQRIVEEHRKWSKLVNYEAGVAWKAHAQASASWHDLKEMKDTMGQILSRLDRTRDRAKYPPDIRAIFCLYTHRDWPVARIAEEVGVSRQTLYKYPLFKQAWQREKERSKKSWPRGIKDGETGKIEAWEASEDET